MSVIQHIAINLTTLRNGGLVCESEKDYFAKKLPCRKCPYKLEIIKTLANPCLQCKQNNYNFKGVSQ